MHQGNQIANLALLLWIPFGLIAARQFGQQKGILMTLLGGTLLLPEKVAFDLPFFLPFYKHSIATFSAWLGWFSVRTRRPQHNVRSKAPTYLLVLVLMSVLLTTLTNLNPIRSGPRTMPGLDVAYTVSVSIRKSLQIVLPFYLGSRLFKTPEDLRLLLAGFLLAGLFYAPLALLEVRLSPFAHRDLYGFFQHSWSQMKREGGFRAILFMAHGLAVALFISQTLMISAISSRLRKPLVPISTKLTSPFLIGTLIACKSMGAMFYGIVATPVLWLTTPRIQVRVVRWLALVILFYPLLRLADLVPVEAIVAKVKEIDVARAASLQFRFDNEEVLLEKARQKLLFGWGGWGRNRVYDEFSGENTTVADGQWIIGLGSGGLLLHFIVFGAILFPVLRAARFVQRLPARSDSAKMLAGLCLVVAFGALDLLPNGLFHYLIFFMSGALYGVSIPISSSYPRPSR